MTLKRVLVATDFGEPSDAAVTYGRNIARVFAATLHIVHVIDDACAHGTPPLSQTFDVAQLQRTYEHSAREALDGLLDPQMRTEGVVTEILTGSRPAPVILSYAKESMIDLIVMGTHGRRGFADLFMGSVAQQVVRDADCPVLTLRRSSTIHVDGARAMTESV
ncbi:MAG: universal stress protein [Vicinamibacterales bacterium]